MKRNQNNKIEQITSEVIYEEAKLLLDRQLKNINFMRDRVYQLFNFELLVVSIIVAASTFVSNKIMPTYKFLLLDWVWIWLTSVALILLIISIIFSFLVTGAFPLKMGIKTRELYQDLGNPNKNEVIKKATISYLNCVEDNNEIHKDIVDKAKKSHMFFFIGVLFLIGSTIILIYKILIGG
ncbi:MAG: hypothetical protein PHS47_04920 [Methanocellales archaeon]|nr:hypothetical protein [Methanocellales archaeon]MDD3421621.1 hypothetical protein [Methanocellales archaeon]MDD5447413.1 hypothetical protein [Methanocellales archaeon]